jgi:hypothetical protein
VTFNFIGSCMLLAQFVRDVKKVQYLSRAFWELSSKRRVSFWFVFSSLLEQTAQFGVHNLHSSSSVNKETNARGITFVKHVARITEMKN